MLLKNYSKGSIRTLSESISFKENAYENEDFLGEKEKTFYKYTTNQIRLEFSLKYQSTIFLRFWILYRKSEQYVVGYIDMYIYFCL